MSCNSTTSASCSTPAPPCEDPELLRKTAESIAVSCCYGALVPLTVVGNGLVIAACVINPKLRTPTNIFICGLALSDLMVGTFSLPYWTFVSSHASVMIGHCFDAYDVYISFDVFAGCASILQVTAIALERYVFTVFPLRHRRMPKRVYAWMLAFAWSVSMLMGALNWSQQTHQWQHVYTAVLFASCCFCPLIIIIIVYGYIFKIGRYHSRSRRSSSTHVGSSGGVLKQFDLAITALVITGVFIAAWLPFFLVSLIATFCLECLPAGTGLSHLIKFVKLVQYAGSSVNPYIYAYRSREMRRTFRKLLRKLFARCLCGRGPDATLGGKSQDEPNGSRGAKTIFRSGSFKRDSMFRSASFRRKNIIADYGKAKEEGNQNQAQIETKDDENVSESFSKVAYVWNCCTLPNRCKSLLLTNRASSFNKNSGNALVSTENSHYLPAVQVLKFLFLLMAGLILWHQGWVRLRLRFRLYTAIQSEQSETRYVIINTGEGREDNNQL